MSKLCFVILLLVVPGSAMAQDSSQMLDRMRAADTNRDGVIAKPELVAFRAASFARIDRSGDGYLTEGDIPAFLRGRGGMVDIVAMKEQFDADGDGKVSRLEFVNGPTLVFDRADRNRDGRLTSAEIDAAIAAAKAKGR